MKMKNMLTSLQTEIEEFGIVISPKDQVTKRLLDDIINHLSEIIELSQISDS